MWPFLSTEINPPTDEIQFIFHLSHEFDLSFGSLYALLFPWQLT